MVGTAEGLESVLIQHHKMLLSLSQENILISDVLVLQPAAPLC